MNDTLARILLAIAAFLLAALLMGVFAGSARGLVLCSVALLSLAACRVKRPAGAQDEEAAAAGGAPVGVCVLDEDHNVLWCNGAAAGHFGIAPRAATGLPVARVIFAQEFDAWLAAADYSRPLKLETSRGVGAVLSISMVPHLHSQWLLLSRDVTLETRAEALRRDGVAEALHELCTPVTVLAGHVDSLRRYRMDPWRSADYLEFMEHQCRRMQSTIGDLVKLWTLETAPARPAEERIDVCAILAEVRADIEALSSGRHYIALDAQAGLGLYGCAAEIASVARNLAVNAIRYTPDGGAVWIVWRQTAGGAELTVEDNGIGIPKEHVPRLTERFYRVDRERSRAAGGSGLGLAIVKGVLNRHGALLEIASEPGRGSRFSAKFPAGRVITIAPPTVVEPAADWTDHELEHDVALSLPAGAMRLPDMGAKAPLQAL